MTTSTLFAGQNHREGDSHCFLCGAKCDESFLSNDYIKDTFTNRDSVKCPSSKYLCAGCAESLGWGNDEMLMLDGSIKKRTNEKGMAPRMYSWLITKNNRIAFTKAHSLLIREIILNNQPEPPFSIIFSDSGQKHLIFRSPISLSKDEFPVMLEEEIIYVKPDVLKERLDMALPIVAAIGKPVLLEELTLNNFITYEKYHGNIIGLEAWQQVQHEPISRLAAWLSKSKEDAQDECPAIELRRISEKVGGIDRSRKEASGHGTGSNQGRGDQAVLDFS